MSALNPQYISYDSVMMLPVQLDDWRPGPVLAQVRGGDRLDRVHVGLGPGLVRGDGHRGAARSSGHGRGLAAVEEVEGVEGAEGVGHPGES